MPITTLDGLVVKPSTVPTEKVMKEMSGYRTQRQIIQQFFGLDDRIVMDADGVSVLEVFNDFVDPIKLEEKGVQWIPKLESLGVSKESFDALLGKYLNYGKTNTIPSGTNTESTGETNTLAWVESSPKATRGRKKKSEWQNDA